ncbi:MAG: POTRA domain-containing protein, partial [Polaribacter sp.]
MKKLSIYFLLIFFLFSCNSTEHVIDGKYLLTKNTIVIDSVKTSGTELQKYILQKPNSRFLGMPFGVYFYNIGDTSKPKKASEWAIKNPKSYQFIKRFFSEKQSIAYANSFINLNKWFLEFDAPELLNEKKIKKTQDNLSAYYKTQGFFKSKVSAKIDTLKKKAKVTYQINKGNPTVFDSIQIKIQSPILDSIYKNSGITTLLKKGEQYKDQTFRNEAKEVVKLFRNNGIYNFTESALGFYVDS